MNVIDILQAFQSKKVFGLLPKLKDLGTWRSWMTALKAIFGLPFDKEDQRIFYDCTLRSNPPAGGAKETYIIVGRRGGKSFIAAIIACFIGCFQDFRQYGTVGETLVILCLAKDKEQARIVFKYIKSILNFIPMLRAKIVEQRADEIELDTGVTIMVKTSDYGGVRGPTVVAAILDEIAFWSQQGVNPDNEVVNALRPGMMTIPESKLIFISTGYAQAGVLYEAHRRYFGKNDRRILVWQAPSIKMNPTLLQGDIDEQIERDPEAGRAEWLGQFREDISACFPLESIEAAIVPGRTRLVPQKGLSYFGFVDMSGGRGDSFTLAIGHVEKRKAVVDSLMILPPSVGTKQATKAFSDELRLYKLTQVTGDNYSGDWAPKEFLSEPNYISYLRCEVPKSGLYLALVPALNSRAVELPDNPTLVTELRRLERRRGRSGKDSVDHPSSGHDDAANSVAGLVYHLLLTMTGVNLDLLTVDGVSFKGSRDSNFYDHPVDRLMHGRGGDAMEVIGRRWNRIFDW